MGRPSDFTEELADEICARLAEGVSLRTVCKADGMPDKATVFRWLRTNPTFRDQYARAKEDSADALVEDMLDIADTPEEGIRTKETVDGTETTTEDMLGHRRLQVDTRKWIAAKLKPKKYGDRVEHEHKGTLTLEALVAGDDKDSSA